MAETEKPFLSPNDTTEKGDKGETVVVAQKPSVVGARITKLLTNNGMQERPKPTGYKVLATWEDTPNVTVPHKVGETLSPADVDVPKEAIAAIVARSEAKAKKDKTGATKPLTATEARQSHLDLLVDMGMLAPIFPAEKKAEAATTTTTTTQAAAAANAPAQAAAQP